MWVPVEIGDWTLSRIDPQACPLRDMPPGPGVEKPAASSANPHRRGTPKEVDNGESGWRLAQFTLSSGTPKDLSASGRKAG
jgi:hypothetical protein